MKNVVNKRNNLLNEKLMRKWGFKKKATLEEELTSPAYGRDDGDIETMFDFRDDEIATLPNPEEQKILNQLLLRAQEIGGEEAIAEIPQDPKEINDFFGVETELPLSDSAERILKMALKDIAQRKSAGDFQESTRASKDFQGEII